MRIDMTPMLSSRSDRLDFSFEYEGENGMFEGISFDKPVSVVGHVSEKAGCMLLTLKASVSYDTECARCLKKLSGTCEIDFVRTVAVRLEEEHDDDEYILVGENSCVTIDEALMEELSEDEVAVYKRGRNAKSYTQAKNASIQDYRKAIHQEVPPYHSSRIL